MLCLLILSGKAQSVPPARIHFFNAVAGSYAELKVTGYDKNLIKVRSRTWVIIQTAGDSVGFLVNNKPYFVHFEPGKQYYFVAQVNTATHMVITEKSEREFIMTVSINSAKGPEEYNLTKLPN